MTKLSQVSPLFLFIVNHAVFPKNLDIILKSMKKPFIVGTRMCKNVSFPLVLALLIASLMVIATSSASPSMTENSWTTKAPMKEARAYLGVAVVNGKIYAIGGDTGSPVGNGPGPTVGTYRLTPVVNTTEEYDPATNQWKIKTQMPTARAMFGTVVYQNKIYCIGGYITHDDSTSANEMYDPVTDSWVTKAAMPTPAYGVQANAVGDKIYVIGKGVNYVYDPATDSWSSKTPPPTEIQDRFSAVVGSKVYFIGYLADLSNVVQTYDTLNDNWSVLTEAPAYPPSENGGGVNSGVLAPKQICFFDYEATYVFDITNNSWTVGAQMPTARICVGVAVVNDTFYVIGGRSGEWGYITIMNASALTEQYVPFGYKPDSTQPDIAVQSPEAKTYYESYVSLNFTVNEPVSLMQYSLDAQDNITITGNTTLSQLSYGLHNVTIYAQDNAENVGASETIIFTIAMAPKPPEPFPAALVVASTGTVAIVGVGLLVYFRKRKR